MVPLDTANRPPPLGAFSSTKYEIAVRAWLTAAHMWREEMTALAGD